MKKLLCMVMSILMAVPLMTTVFAMSDDSKESQVQMVETVYDNNKLVTIFDEDMVTMKRYSLDTNELLVEVQWKRDSDYITVTKDGNTEAESIVALKFDGNNVQSSIARARTLSNSTILGYSYTLTYGSPNYWNLSCPKYDNGGKTYSFVCTERDSYYDKLQAFKVDVDNMNAIEKKIEARTSAKYLNAAFAAAFLATGTPEGFAVAFSAWFADRGYDVEIQDLAADMGIYQKDAYDKYWRIQKEWTELLSLTTES